MDQQNKQLAAAQLIQHMGKDIQHSRHYARCDQIFYDSPDMKRSLMRAKEYNQREHASDGRKLAFLAGGETVVHVTGDGLGGRNQELSLAACEALKGMKNAAVISVGSDGTDGPTDAAGGYVDGESFDALLAAGLDLHEVLRRNDSYHALKAIGGLVVTGPTGTNVNDVCLGLLDLP